jgi:hypothetical protein
MRGASPGSPASPCMVYVFPAPAGGAAHAHGGRKRRAPRAAAPHRAAQRPGPWRSHRTARARLPAIPPRRTHPPEMQMAARRFRARTTSRPRPCRREARAGPRSRQQRATRRPPRASPLTAASRVRTRRRRCLLSVRTDGRDASNLCPRSPNYRRQSADARPLPCYGYGCTSYSDDSHVTNRVMHQAPVACQSGFRQSHKVYGRARLGKHYEDHMNVAGAPRRSRMPSKVLRNLRERRTYVDMYACTLYT